MGQPTYEQVDLMLKLYELRREPRLREARTWFVDHYSVSSPEEMLKKYPPGSTENTNIRMTISYWDMVASIVHRGLIDEEMFFENTGEIWLVWDRIRPALLAGATPIYGAPETWAGVQLVYACSPANPSGRVMRLEEWREKRAPGSTAAMKQMLEQMARSAAKATGE